MCGAPIKGLVGTHLRTICLGASIIHRACTLKAGSREGFEEFQGVWILFRVQGSGLLVIREVERKPKAQSVWQ